MSTVIIGYHLRMTINIHEKPGRPYEITLDKVNQIIGLYRKTLVMSNIAGQIGHTVDTIKSWMRQGEIDYSAHEDTLFAKLFLGVKKSISERVIELEEAIMDNETGWQRFSWLLERTVRRDYSVYGEIWEDFESKLGELMQKQLEREQPRVREISVDMRQWIKQRLTDGNQKSLAIKTPVLEDKTKTKTE